MANETLVQVAPNSAGQKIRNLQLTIQQADGTLATVLMQVIAMSDEAGQVIVPIAARDFETWSSQVLDELKLLRLIVAQGLNVRL